MMYEMFSPHTDRLLDGSRRREWDRTRPEILRIVKDVNETSGNAEEQQG